MPRMFKGKSAQREEDDGTPSFENTSLANVYFNDENSNGEKKKKKKKRFFPKKFWLKKKYKRDKSSFPQDLNSSEPVLDEGAQERDYLYKLIVGARYAAHVCYNLCCINFMHRKMNCSRFILIMTFCYHICNHKGGPK